MQTKQRLLQKGGMRIFEDWRVLLATIHGGGGEIQYVRMASLWKACATAQKRDLSNWHPCILLSGRSCRGKCRVGWWDFIRSESLVEYLP